MPDAITRKMEEKKGSPEVVSSTGGQKEKPAEAVVGIDPASVAGKAMVEVIAGVDVHKRMLAVVVRIVRADGKLEYQKRKFGTTRQELEMHLMSYLQFYGVTMVVMESTAQYWRPVWYALEKHFELRLVNPLQVKAPRGKKQDYRDAQRLADRWAASDLQASYVPGQEQREWRLMTRQRDHLRKRIGVTRNLVEGLLESGTYKLSSVVSDIFGATGWAVLQLIAKGETKVDVLVKEARGSLRKKESALREALKGEFTVVYRLALQQYLAQVALYRAQIEELNRQLSEAMKHHLAALTRLMKIPGVDLYGAQELLAEIGPKAAAFPSADQFASWVGVCPGSKESAGVNYSSRSAKGNRFLRRLLLQVAWAAIHTKETFFAGLFKRLKPSIEGKGAAWAVAHRIARVVWLVLHQEVEYQEKGPGQVSPRTLSKKLKRILKECARHGIDPRKIMSEIPESELLPVQTSDADAEATI
ncbi:MAG TPA: IS110 family transposase [Candidatus Acidoferrales bacterium]|nr:IS110 family transposase [Candidatus Acidoferrales bacterium]